MSQNFHDKKPIYKQIKEQIEDQILDGRIKEQERAPSTNELVKFYKVNHLTIAKGVNELVDEEILYKKRGVGMFVTDGARKKLMQGRRQAFADSYVADLLAEAEKLSITKEELIDIISTYQKGRDRS
ncbi:GntR family transcriptional regulator [Paenalkalicoccus suaedae]|uniref:GntR family transcriptional regulator n=1 Tax=Paenalkalicoccus suaedae TaxID=2592382 RepID=A0A859FC96_9BACI|nr:GntR family transcriptional regulator [Paenalkalicoccus suaedae]QKS70392.1 GntR family transcriptional regulator [Paenalkalicoccus suaedae]